MTLMTFFQLFYLMFKCITSQGLFLDIKCLSEKSSKIFFKNMIFQSILIKHEFCLYVCSRFPKPPKVPGSWNFGSRPNLGQLKSLRSPIFEILIFKGGSPYGPVLKIRDKLCRVFRSHQKSQCREILALGLIWANLKHDEARFSKFWFLRILWAFFVFLKMRFLVFFRVFFENLSHFNT